MAKRSNVSLDVSLTELDEVCSHLLGKATGKNVVTAGFPFAALEAVQATLQTVLDARAYRSERAAILVRVEDAAIKARTLCVARLREPVNMYCRDVARRSKAGSEHEGVLTKFVLVLLETSAAPVSRPPKSTTPPGNGLARSITRQVTHALARNPSPTRGRTPSPTRGRSPSKTGGSASDVEEELLGLFADEFFLADGARVLWLSLGYALPHSPAVLTRLTWPHAPSPATPQLMQSLSSSQIIAAIAPLIAYSVSHRSPRSISRDRAQSVRRRHRPARSPPRVRELREGIDGSRCQVHSSSRRPEPQWETGRWHRTRRAQAPQPENVRLGLGGRL